jgi:hypothetical protein
MCWISQGPGSATVFLKRKKMQAKHRIELLANVVFFLLFIPAAIIFCLLAGFKSALSDSYVAICGMFDLMFIIKDEKK